MLESVLLAILILLIVVFIVAVIIVNLDEKETRIGAIFFVSLLCLLCGKFLGDENYRNLTALKTGNTYKVLSVAECSENNFCFVLKNQGDEQKENYYRLEKTKVDETIETGDLIIYTNDEKLKILNKNSDSEESEEKE